MCSINRNGGQPPREVPSSQEKVLLRPAGKPREEEAKREEPYHEGPDPYPVQQAEWYHHLTSRIITCTLYLSFYHHPVIARDFREQTKYRECTPENFK
jgi:hypothetical protein